MKDRERERERERETNKEIRKQRKTQTKKKNESLRKQKTIADEAEKKTIKITRPSQLKDKANQIRTFFNV